MVPRSTALVAATASALLFWSATAEAAPIVLEGDVPTGGPDHFFLDFEVPAGTKEIEIAHDDLSEANILDFGLYDPGGYRGWGGGTTEPTVVAETGASRAYLAGPITPGTWRVVVGKAKVVESPARYRVTIELRTAQTIASTAATRRPYAPAAARKKETRYYAGDLHVHSRESTDAEPTIQDNIALAKQRGLDFIEESEHNTVTQLDFYGPIQDGEPDFLLLPGIEFTTYAGHANAIGATRWVDHKIGQPGVTIAGAADAIEAQGAVLGINHPVIDVGDLCIGCAWKHDLPPEKIGAVEIGTLGLSNGGALFSAQAIAFWDALLDKGSRAAAVGGSDDHRAGKKSGFLSSVVGSPTTMVRADELSAAAIVEGIKKGRTVVKLDGPDDPMAELEVAAAKGGDALGHPGDALGVRSVHLRVKVTKGLGSTVRFVKNGAPLDAVPVNADPFEYDTVVEPPAGGEDRFRAEVLVDDKPRTVTSHVWLHLDPAGPEAAAAAPDDDGCAVSAPRSRQLPIAALAISALVAVAIRRRRPTTER